MDNKVNLKRKRLRYRSWHRGTKELDLLLGKFAEQYLDELTTTQLEKYEAILESDEYDIYEWITGRKAIPPEHDNSVMAAICAFRITDYNG